MSSWMRGTRGSLRPCSFPELATPVGSAEVRPGEPGDTCAHARVVCRLSRRFTDDHGSLLRPILACSDTVHQNDN
jgi:hypothetical protein